MIQKIEIDSQTQKSDLWLPKGWGWGGEGEGWIENLELVDANDYVQNG